MERNESLPLSLSISLSEKKGKSDIMFWGILFDCHLTQYRPVAFFYSECKHIKHAPKRTRVNTKQPLVLADLGPLLLWFSWLPFSSLRASECFFGQISSLCVPLLHQKGMGLWIGFYSFGFRLKALRRQTCVEHYCVCAHFEEPPRYIQDLV